ncbi:MAG: M20/M25/M40 family metallo-hydrolase [Clostridia bacterium]
MLLEELTAARGVSGDEGDIRALLQTLCEARGAQTRVDRMGNLLAHKTGPIGARHVMLAAHMDEVGLLITGVAEGGLLRYQPVGGIDPRVMVSKRVRVGKQAVPGVIGAKAIHLQTKEETERVLDHKDLYVDVGAKTCEEAEKLCPPGSYVAFDSPLVAFGAHCVLGKALDDRVGCLAMLTALEMTDLPVSLTCAFTVQEEVGLRGAQVAAQHVLPDLALILEGTTCNDLGDVPADQQVCNLGRGVAVSFMDRASLAHPGLRAAVLECARAHDIAHQPKRGTSGGNDAGAIQRAFGARPTVVLSVPCRYIHSPVSVASTEDIAAQQALVCAFLRDEPIYEGRIFA